MPTTAEYLDNYFRTGSLEAREQAADRLGISTDEFDRIYYEALDVEGFLSIWTNDDSWADENAA